MKKNISINISGIIFHIEEDGYEILRKYLDSINRYFSSFEDNSEILADIESRIAEILLSKLSEGKQVVTADDVHSVMATMGSVNDFKAAEEQEASGTSSGAGPEQRQQERRESTDPKMNIAAKKLYRDNRRKILGGVSSGLAHYFGIDPVWPRMLLVLLAFATYGGLVVAYIILWVIIPASDSLEDETSTKKMYRDSDNRVVGGVAAGLAAFWGIDATVVRVLFIGMSIFGGLGVVVYIIMWIALPEARTITERMKMSGEPVTLSNIESSVKKGLSDKDGAEESVFAKIILFPFRLIAAIIDGLARVLGPVFILLVDVFRIGIGLCITLTGALLIFTLIIAFSMVFGLYSVPIDSAWNDWYVTSPNLPLDVMRRSFPTWPAIFAFIAVFVPALMISLLGASIIARKIVFNSYVGWSLFVLFFISVGVLSFAIPQIVMAYKEDGEFRTEQTFQIKGTPVFRVHDIGHTDYEVTDLSIRSYEGKELKLVQRFRAQGKTHQLARENAQMVTYSVTQADSVLTFDSNISFKDDAIFRAQRLEMDLYVPTNAPFVMEEGMWRFVDNRWEGRHYSDRDDTQTWKVNEYGSLECITCYKSGSRNGSSSIDGDSAGDSAGDTSGFRAGSFRDDLGLRNFNSIDLEGAFDVTIEQGDDFAVEIDHTERTRDQYRIYVSGETLVVDYEHDSRGFWKKRNWQDEVIRIQITMPQLREVEAGGGGKVRFRGFDEDEMLIELTGAVVANAGVDARNMKVKLTGASSLDLAGTGRWLQAEINGASTLSAYGYEVADADVEAHGASSAKVYVTDKLEISKGVASSVSHRGDPNVIREND
ncbi:MAG TPA: PspC domain-containing protein [Cyclobacteriaceae bacterium]|nr:PspC domain-containing protein [Cyclobacteriaceae bacterium]